VFEFVWFAFYTLIISHHICCFSVHLIAKLFVQSSVFNVFEFLLTYLSKQLKNINITTFTHQNNCLNFTFVCTSTINKVIKKIKNSKLFTLHSSVFHTLKLFSYLILSESYKQKHYTSLEVLIFLMSHLTKLHSKNIKKPHITSKSLQNIKITFTSLYFTLKTLLFQSFRLLSESFRLLLSLLN